MADMDIKAARANTAAVAQEALTAGLISQADFNNMTDGTVSYLDSKLAKNIVIQNSSGAEGQEGVNADIGRRLQVAIGEQNLAQGALETIAENVKDIRR